MRAKTYITAVVCTILSVVEAGYAQYDPKYDYNNDSVIDALDLLEFQQHWHAMGNLLPTSTPSPRPIMTPTPTRTPVTGDLVVDLGAGVQMAFMLMPAGSFMMGRYPGEQDSDSDEDPQHLVTLSQDFYLGKYEVTKAQWHAVMETTPWSGRTYMLDAPDSPAVYVSWNDAQAFITALNQLGQGTFRLPSEAEWEYACRAGTTTRFYWGDDPNYSMIGDFGWCGGDVFDLGEMYAHVVGQKLPNGWGLYDMSGNVEEWCQDYWHSSYDTNGDGLVDAPTDGSAWEWPTSSHWVLRGGAWDHAGNLCRSAHRFGNDPISTRDNYGFRVVWTP